MHADLVFMIYFALKELILVVVVLSVTNVEAVPHVARHCDFVKNLLEFPPHPP